MRTYNLRAVLRSLCYFKLVHSLTPTVYRDKSNLCDNNSVAVHNDLRVSVTLTFDIKVKLYANDAVPTITFNLLNKNLWHLTEISTLQFVDKSM